MIKWAYEPALRRRRLRRDRLEKVVSKVIATTTVRPCSAAIIEFARTDFHRRVEWVAERMEMNELYWRGTEHVCVGSTEGAVAVSGVMIHAGRCSQDGWWAGQKWWYVIGVVWACPLRWNVSTYHVTRVDGMTVTDS